MTRFPDDETGLHRRAYKFALDTARVVDDIPWQRNSGRVTSYQLAKSATSVGANLHEANAAHSRADFIYKCSTALKEAHETIYWLHLCGDLDLISRRDSDRLISDADELVAILATVLHRATSFKE